MSTTFGDGAIEAIDRKKAATYALLLNWSGTLEADAKSNAPWTDRTGHARQGIHGGVDRDGDLFLLFLAHAMRYGVYLETGTGLHGPHKQKYLIKPKDKQALFWAGAIHPVKEIWHPGMEPRSIIDPTLASNIERIRLSLRELWSE